MNVKMYLKKIIIITFIFLSIFFTNVTYLTNASSTIKYTKITNNREPRLNFKRTDKEYLYISLHDSKGAKKDKSYFLYKGKRYNVELIERSDGVYTKDGKRIKKSSKKYSGKKYDYGIKIKNSEIDYELNNIFVFSYDYDEKCFLKETFKIKKTDKKDKNGCYYQLDRAPRVTVHLLDGKPKVDALDWSGIKNIKIVSESTRALIYSYEVENASVNKNSGNDTKKEKSGYYLISNVYYPIRVQEELNMKELEKAKISDDKYKIRVMAEDVSGIKSEKSMITHIYSKKISSSSKNDKTNSKKENNKKESSKEKSSNKTKVKTIKFEKSVYEVEEGKTITISSKIEPSNANDYSLNWSTSGDAIKITEKNGTKVTVKGLKGGKEAKLIVKDKSYSEGKEPVAECKIKVKKQSNAQNNNPSSGGTNQNNNPSSGGTNQNNNPSSGGTNQNNNPSGGGTNQHTPSGNSSQKIPITKIEFKKKRYEVTEGNTVKLGIKITPSNANNYKLAWSVKSNKVASLDKSNSGNITGLKEGETTVKVVATDKGTNKVVSDECKVKVNKQGKFNFTLSKSAITTSTNGKEQKHKVTITGYDKKYNSNTVYFDIVSSNTKVAKVDPSWSGSTRGFTVSTNDNYGSATITVKAYIENASKTIIATKKIKVTVKKGIIPAKSIKIEPSSNGKISIQKGQTIQFKAIVEPSTTTDKVIWSMKSIGGIPLPDGISIDSNTGKVKAKKAISADCYVIATCGNVSARQLVDVKLLGGIKSGDILVSSIKLSSTKMSLKVGEEKKLTATVLPSNAKNKKIKWDAFDRYLKNYVTVNKNGVVKGKKIGKSTVYAYAQDGSGRYATCEVNVIKPATNIELYWNSNNKKISGTTINIKGNTSIYAKVIPTDATNKDIKVTSSDKNVLKAESWRWQY